MTLPTCTVDWFHISFALTMLFSLQDFSWKKTPKKRRWIYSAEFAIAQTKHEKALVDPVATPE